MILAELCLQDPEVTRDGGLKPWRVGEHRSTGRFWDVREDFELNLQTKEKCSTIVYTNCEFNFDDENEPEFEKEFQYYSRETINPSCPFMIRGAQKLSLIHI